MKDKDFLKWIYVRLQNVHGESPLLDYMRKLRCVIKSIPKDQESANTFSNEETEESCNKISYS